MSSTPVLVPVEQYLRTVFRPDRDYIDGEIEERNMGETPHSGLQSFFGWYFRNYQDEWRIDVFTEQRVQITKQRFRVPDVCLTSLDEPFERIIRTPPILCIEILSSEDSLATIQPRIIDYALMGVPCSWVVDPWKRAVFTAGPDGILHPVTGSLTVPNTPIAIEVATIFAELDRLERRSTTDFI
jgi:Uma2 family endonuclease